MRLEGLDTTNVWLAIIAIVSVLQIVALGAVVLFAYKLYSKSMNMLATLEARHVVPLVARANHLMDEAHRVVARVEDAEVAVRDTFKHVADAGTFAAGVVRAKTWPVVAVLRGAQAVYRALANGDAADGGRPRPTASFDSPAFPEGRADIRSTP